MKTFIKIMKKLQAPGRFMHPTQEALDHVRDIVSVWAEPSGLFPETKESIEAGRWIVAGNELQALKHELDVCIAEVASGRKAARRAARVAAGVAGPPRPALLIAA